MKDLSVLTEPFSTKDMTVSWWENYFMSAAEARVVCRRDCAVERFNPIAARLFQFTSEETARSTSICNFLAAPASRQLGRLLQTSNGRAETMHSVSVQSAGTPRALMDLEVVPLGDGFTLVVFKDANRRLRLESHVSRLVTAIDVTPDVFLVTDDSFCISYVNPAFQISTGYSIEEVLGRSEEFLRAPAEIEKVRAYQSCVRLGREWMGELVNFRRDGTSYYVDATVSPISDMAGQFMGYVICERDITMRKQLQNAIRGERDFAQSILQSLDGAIYTLDQTFCLTHVNDGWRRLAADHAGICFPDGPQIGRSLLDYICDPARREELRIVFQEVIASGRSHENHYTSADGCHWLVKISPWINAGVTCGLICNVTDQTHYHGLQNQLFQSQKMEIIGTLAAGVAHDFNNLLQVIRGHSGLMLMDSHLQNSLRRGLGEIESAAGRAAEITRQLLSFARASDEHCVVLDLNQTIQEASRLARRTLRGNVAIELRPLEEPLCVKMDATRASQALLNLCVNAQDAMPNGGQLILANAIVNLTPEQAMREDRPVGVRFARCSVIDTGEGIAADLLPRVFQPFFTTKGHGRGTGLGLSIVQRIVREAGGFVELESIVGQGTTFHLYLALAGEKTTPVADDSSKPLVQGSGCVLVVDDMDLLRDFARTFLEQAGLNVLVAGSGDEALQLLDHAHQSVDLVFTDYNMPGMNGAELMERIIERRPDTQFVVVSGYLDDESRVRVEKYCSDVFIKPYDIHQACEAIVRKLAKK